MQYARQSNYYGGGFSQFVPPGVKWLLIINTGVFLLEFFSALFTGVSLRWLGLVPLEVVFGLRIWELGTYLFLHGGVMHLLFNMLALWMFGSDLERDWGTRRFLRYYFLCGIGAGLTVVIASMLFGGAAYRTIGAFGAIYGILLAYGVLYPDRTVLFFFLFPMKAKYFVMIIGGIVFLNSFQGGGNVSHVAHLGGMVFGYIFLKVRMPRANLLGWAGERYQRWKRERARRRFQVYMRRHGGDRGPWVQ